MTKNITKNVALISMLTASSFSAMAGEVMISASQATQDLSIGSSTVSNTDTGLMAEWHSDDFFDLQNIQQGVSMNTATVEGNVLSYFLRPNKKMANGLEVFAKLGMSITGATTTAGVGGSLQTSLTYGAGISYAINDEYAVIAQYDQLYSDDVWDMSSVSMGVTYSY